MLGENFEEKAVGLVAYQLSCAWVLMSGVVAIECGSLPLTSASDLALDFEAASSSLNVLEPKTTLGKQIVSQAGKTCGTMLMHVMASYCWAMSNARCCDI